LKRFIVVSCEHTDSYDSPVLLSGQFESREEAEAYVKKAVADSLAEFPDEKAVEEDLVQMIDEDGYPKYGCVWTVILSCSHKRTLWNVCIKIVGRKRIR